jgi:hypothetical protein
MSLTVADARVDALDDAIVAAVRGLDRLKVVERELAEIRRSLEIAAEAMWDGIIYDPEGERVDA